jgi:hypothetical protein
VDLRPDWSLVMATDPTIGTTPTPPEPEPPAPPSRITRALVVCELTSLVLALVTLLGCMVVLFVFVGRAIVQENPVKDPEVTQNPGDIYKLIIFSTAEPIREQVRIGQRAAVLRSCGLLAGVASLFLALTLFLLAVRTEAAVAPRDRTLSWSLARLLPATVALVCAAVLISFSAPEGGPAELSGTAHGSPVTTPIAYPGPGPGTSPPSP